ncbi:TetR/AcrR family transcriptional regulator C-terminal domain-containing protein [Solirubrobacter phytolaccae]|uniref:TetR/AcrR family transcriptional regulator C-terminal domain-containing protein n=1 Tax=Solirubrobacter phytolaccae TaxID=1404360 RepID=A0A9X3N351_9ACTN|nr:TetR/AcrR family transcriptional regulator C-terminal domain-containing protein [Solirubrobacter phytolaccae]MDA0178843.1 TetR/AcrR family transcriptional regulator C-terminal domain-containing protein [Solirubrobacter phytolaccae]
MPTASSRSERPALTRDAIVAKAVEIADAEGLDAVSIRRLAADLPARPMSLYNHITDKQELVGLMLDRIIDEGLIGDALSPDWREAMRQIARSARAAAERHPWLTIGLGATRAQRESFHRHHEESLRALAGLRASDADKRRLLLAVDSFTWGHVAMEAARRSEALAAMQIPDDGFEVGLEWILAGAAAALGEPPL